MTLATGIGLELTRPALLAGLAAVPVLVWYFRRSLVDLPRAQKAVSLVVRSLIVLLLVLSLAGLTLLEPTRELYVVFAVDESLSIGDESRIEAEGFIQRAISNAGTNRSAVLRFAAEPESPETELIPTEAARAVPNASSSRARDLPPAAVDPRRAGTDIAAALELAAASIPPHCVPRIVLLTDGNETAGDAVQATLAAGMAVSTVPLPSRDDPEVQVSAVQVPAQIPQGEPFYVEVVIDSNHDDEGTIEIFRGAHKIVSERQPVKKGENRFRFRQTVEHERLAEFAVRISGFQDTLLDNNAESGLVYTAGKPRVLLVDSDPELIRPLGWALEEEGLEADIRPPQGMPDSLADLQNYELVILSNVPATALTTRQMETVRTYVQELGGGLAMLGGDQSFGLGGYYKTAIEEILPVRSDFEKEKETPSLAMVLVIDKSGSMGGEPIELAKDAANAAVELLGPRDQVGVLAFEGDVFWVAEVRTAGDKAFLRDRIRSIEAGGGTNMAPAMDEAYRALQAATAKLKHVIILTDGISAPGDFEGLARAMASSQITVSTVGFGEADQNLLEEIARIGRGRYYYSDSPANIPQIFAKETMTASKSAINEEPFVPQIVRPTPVLGEIDFETAPFLLGYVVTRPKPTGEIILATESGDPLLAWWRYGLGMCVAFTSDAKSRWGAEWLSWPGFNRFWAQVVRHAMRKGEAKGFVVQVERRGSKAAITLDSVDPAGSFLNNAPTELTIIGPDLTTTKAALTQAAPGRYVGEIDVPARGAYHLELAQQHQGQVLYRQSRGLIVGYPDELRLRPTNEALLKSIASASGGQYDPAAEDVFAPPVQSARRATPLWPWLTIAALLLFVADVALRRIDFSLIAGRIATAAGGR